MNPGQIAFTLIGPKALARDLVMLINAPFEAAYATELPIPKTPAIDATFTTEGLSDLARYSLDSLIII